jgi:hypothetical protein
MKLGLWSLLPSPSIFFANRSNKGNSLSKTKSKRIIVRAFSTKITEDNVPEKEEIKNKLMSPFFKVTFMLNKRVTEAENDQRERIYGKSSEVVLHYKSQSLTVTQVKYGDNYAYIWPEDNHLDQYEVSDVIQCADGIKHNIKEIRENILNRQDEKDLKKSMKNWEQTKVSLPLLFCDSNESLGMFVNLSPVSPRATRQTTFKKIRPADAEEDEFCAGYLDRDVCIHEKYATNVAPAKLTCCKHINAAEDGRCLGEGIEFSIIRQGWVQQATVFAGEWDVMIIPKQKSRYQIEELSGLLNVDDIMQRITETSHHNWCKDVIRQTFDQNMVQDLASYFGLDDRMINSGRTSPTASETSSEGF